MPAFDAVASATGFTSTTTTLAFSHTCGASATLLVVGVGIGSHALNDAGISLSATYNGVAMTDLSGQAHNGGQTFGFGQVFYLLSPTTGSAQNVVITRSGGTGVLDILGNAVSYTAADAPTGLSTALSASGGSGTVSNTITVPSGSLGAQLAEAGSAFSAASHTSRYQHNLNTSSGGGNMAYQDTDTSGSVTLTRTITPDVWSGIAFSIPAAVVPQPEGTKNASAMRAMTGGRF